MGVPDEGPGGDTEFVVEPLRIEEISHVFNAQLEIIAYWRFALYKKLEELRDTVAAWQDWADVSPLQEALESLQYASWESLGGAVNSLYTFTNATEFAAYQYRVHEEQQVDRIESGPGGLGPR